MGIITNKRIKKKTAKKAVQEAAQEAALKEKEYIEKITQITGTIDGETRLSPAQQNAIIDALEAGIPLEAQAM